MTEISAEQLAGLMLLQRAEADGRKVPVDCSTPLRRSVMAQLYDLGLVNIAPPGWRYVLNDAGRQVLEAERHDPPAAPAVAPATSAPQLPPAPAVAEAV